MADVKAGQQDAQQDEQLDDGEQQQDGAEGEGGEQKVERQAERTYTQAELDRILGKVRKNARYLGRKEAEAELRAQGATATQARETVDRQQQEQQQLKAPKREDFENYEDFLDAKTDYRTRLVSREEREKAASEARAERIKEERQSSERAFRKHAEAVMKEIPDFAETIESAENVMITEAMGEAITEAGALGPRILYHLVQNPEEAERISGIKSKAAQAREIGKLEARIEAELAAAAKKGKDQEQEEDAGDGEAGDDDKGGDDLDESEADAKGKDTERRADGTFKPVKKRAAPEPIEPGTARGATGSRLPSDKDDINTWMRKEEERERREGRR